MIDGGGKWIKVELVQSGSRLQVTTLQRHQKIILSGFEELAETSIRSKIEHMMMSQLSQKIRQLSMVMCSARCRSATM